MLVHISRIRYLSKTFFRNSRSLPSDGRPVFARDVVDQLGATDGKASFLYLHTLLVPLFLQQTLSAALTSSGIRIFLSPPVNPSSSINWPVSSIIFMKPVASEPWNTLGSARSTRLLTPVTRDHCSDHSLAVAQSLTTSTCVGAGALIKACTKAPASFSTFTYGIGESTGNGGFHKTEPSSVCRMISS